MSENHEFKKIDLNQLQKVEVRDSGKEDWKVRRLLKVNEKNTFPFIVIDEGLNTSVWKHCRPYKEPAKRLMTDREIFNALKKEDCWLRLPENNSNQFCSWNIQWIAEEYEITYDGGETWHKLEVEE